MVDSQRDTQIGKTDKRERRDKKRKKQMKREIKGYILLFMKIINLALSGKNYPVPTER